MRRPNYFWQHFALNTNLTEPTRNLKKSDTPILAGMQIFHNYVRPHMGLEGKTPAEAARIEVQGNDKWITIIQNASKAKGRHA